jgi:hypothetical protein
MTEPNYANHMYAIAALYPVFDTLALATPVPNLFVNTFTTDEGQGRAYHFAAPGQLPHTIPSLARDNPLYEQQDYLNPMTVPVYKPVTPRDPRKWIFVMSVSTDDPGQGRLAHVWRVVYMATSDQPGLDGSPRRRTDGLKLDYLGMFGGSNANDVRVVLGTQSPAVIDMPGPYPIVQTTFSMANTVVQISEVPWTLAGQIQLGGSTVPGTTTTSSTPTTSTTSGGGSFAGAGAIQLASGWSYRITVPPTAIYYMSFNAVLMLTDDRPPSQPQDAPLPPPTGPRNA